MAFLFPACPRCGGETESTEPDTFEVGTRRMGQYLQTQALEGHSHPVLKIVRIGLIVGRQIYKRVPGGGDKRCTACGHQFN